MSNKQKVMVTQEGLNELVKEQEYLIHVVRKEVKEELKAARDQGDLSENADYDAARDRQAKIEARIRELENMLNNVELIDENKTTRVKKVQLGRNVVIKELDSGLESEYAIVGSVESDPLNGKLSNQTPLAMAIMEKKVGDVVVVPVQPPYEVEILKIK